MVQTDSLDEYGAFMIPESLYMNCLLTFWKLLRQS